MRAFAAGLALVSAASAAEVKLITFDGEKDTTFSFQEMNDPVMGGESTGAWSVSSDGQYGIMDGNVVNVPKLAAPGFIKAIAKGTFVDASSAAGGDLVLEVRSSTPEYDGFRVSVAAGALSPEYSCASGGTLPLSRGCFKTHFNVPAGDNFTQVKIPLSSFSDLWSPYTGDITKTCAQDSSACLTAAGLAKIQRIELWGEGKGGKVHLEVRSISVASPSLGAAFRPPSSFDKCTGPVQSNLRYGISGRTTPTVPVTVDQDETLAEAICCDSRVVPLPEPQFLYAAPDIQLFQHVSSTGVTTFYDSVCGVPVFRAPVNRSRDEWEEESAQNGWPSFRSAEVITENVIVNSTTQVVYSSCGTRLGSHHMDAKGPRWCIDLSCIAGNPVPALSITV